MSEKFSDFIRAPGTAGPPTREGIRALGFALQSDFPVELEKYVWVGGAQTFSAGEQEQGRENIDAQEFSASLTSLAGLTTAADQIAYTTGPNAWAVTSLTSFARTILDDANAAAVRTTIGLGNVDNTSDANKPVSTAQQTALNLKADLASPAFTGNPTAPTASPGDNDTTIATTAFVQAAAGSGRIVQTQSQFTGAVATGTTSIPNDDTIPQITEGDPYLSAVITPTNAANILEITVQIAGSLNSGAQAAMALFKVGTSDALTAVYMPPLGSGVVGIGTLKFRIAAGSTSAQTFSVRAGASSAGATFTLNGAAGARRFGGVMNSFITVEEISQ